MSFIDNIPRLMDFQELHKQAFPDFNPKSGMGLAAVIPNLVHGKKLCKSE